MDEISVQKLYKYYETINDFNRLRILICLTKGDYTKEEIATILNMKPIVVYTHLNYFCVIFPDLRRHYPNSDKIHSSRL